MYGGSFGKPSVAEPISLTTSIVRLNTLLAAAAFNVATTKVFIQNKDASGTVYWSWKTTAPANVAAMGEIPAKAAIQLQLEGKDLDNIWVAGSGSITGWVYQEGM